MDIANFQTVKNSVLSRKVAEQLSIVWAVLWRATRANANNTQKNIFYNLKKNIEDVCNNAGARDNTNSLIGFGYYKNVYLTQEQYDELVTSHTQDIVCDAVNQLSAKLNAGEYQTNDYLRSIRDFIKTEKLFRAKFPETTKKVEYTRHNYSAESLREVEADISVF